MQYAAPRYPVLTKPRWARCDHRALRGTKRHGHGPIGDEIRRHLGGRYRAHPQCRAPCRARGRRPATRWPWWSRPWRGRPTSWSAGAARRRQCTMRANMTRSSPPANRSPPGFWPSCCRTWGFRRAPGWAGRCRSSTDGVHGSARIAEIDAHEIRKRMEQGQVAVMAGLPGHRPGQAHHHPWAAAAPTRRRWRWRPRSMPRCDIYTDVDGVYTTDPRIVAKARRLDRIAYEEMLEMASLGAKVLQTRSVELAMVYKVPLQVRSSFEPPDSPIRTGRTAPARNTRLRRGRSWNSMWSAASPISRDEAKISIRKVPGPAGRFGLDLRAAGRCRHQCRHDRPERVGRRRDRQHHLHRRRARICARRSRS